MPETAYVAPRAAGSRLDHHYGDNVHILADPWSLGLLTRLCHPETDTRAILPLLDACSRILLAAAVEQLPTVVVDAPTRMPGAHSRARVPDPRARAVVVDIARGGILPAHHFQRALMEVLAPDAVRVDHLYLQRRTDPETGGIAGVHHSGSKIGGPVDEATVFVPDPMGATGSTLAYVLDVYRSLAGGPPRCLVACHLIVTPEYLHRIARDAPDVVVYALRVDRGLSADDVLRAAPGARWAEERGLDDRGYVVPGAGGVGEVINNAEG
jgi:uracil phosphoribosyltransferase